MQDSLYQIRNISFFDFEQTCSKSKKNKNLNVTLKTLSHIFEDILE